MTLISGAIARDENGRLLLSAAAPVAFNGGTPITADGSLSAIGAVPPPPPVPPNEDPDGPWVWDYGQHDTTYGGSTVIGTAGITNGALDLTTNAGGTALHKFQTSTKGLEDFSITACMTQPNYGGTYSYGFLGRLNNHTTFESYGFMYSEVAGVGTAKIVRTANNVDTSLASVAITLTDGVEYDWEITVIDYTLTFKIYNPAGTLIVNLTATDYFYAAGQIAYKTTRAPAGSLGGIVGCGAGPSVTIEDFSPGGASGAWTWEPQSTTLMQFSQEGTPSIQAAGGSSLGAYDSWTLRLNNVGTSVWGTHELRATDVVTANGTLEAFIKLPTIPAGSPAVAGVMLGMRCTNAGSATYTGVVCSYLVEGVASGSKLTFYIQQINGGAGVQLVGDSNNLNYASPLIAPGSMCRMTLTAEDEIITARLYSWPANALIITLTMVCYQNITTANLMLRSYRNDGGAVGDNGSRFHQAAFYQGAPSDTPFLPSWRFTGSIGAGVGSLGSPHGAYNHTQQTLGTGDMTIMSESALPTTGKWYWEVECAQPSSQLQDILGIGWSTVLALTSVACGESGHSTIHWLNGTTTSIGTAATTQWNGPARVGFAYDADNLLLWVSINGTFLLAGNPATGANPLFSNLQASPDQATQPRRIWLRGAGDAVISYNWVYTQQSQWAYEPPVGFFPLTRSPGLVNEFAPFTTSLLPLTGAQNSTTFTDVKPVTWTALGNAKIDQTCPAFPSGALLCDGTGDAIQAPDSGDRFDPTGYSFTMEIDVYLDAAGAGTDRGIWGKRATVASIDGHSLYVGADNKLHFIHTGGGGVWHIQMNASVTISTGAKHHIAVTRQGFTWGLWQDGARVASISGSTNGAYGYLNNAQTFTLGAAATDGAASFRGWLANWRCTIGASHYNRPFTPPTSHPSATEMDLINPADPIVVPQLDEDIDIYVGGLPYTDEGQLVVEEGAPVTFAPGGIGITAEGAVAIDSSGDIAGYNAGLPVTAEGALAITVGDGEASLMGAFSPGFEEESFA